jgi:ketosteroid isomerase-like protein
VSAALAAPLGAFPGLASPIMLRLVLLLRGRETIERFLRDFVGAGLQGELRELFTQGPPWGMVLVVRFDDRASGPDGEELYRNRTVLVIRTRWGRIVEHEDFYEDTERIEAFERRPRELGVEPAT